MTPEQRYMFDLTGYLHLENVLSDDELKNAQEATQRHMDTADEDLPPGFGRDGKRHLHGFAFDKCLEALTMHPTTWPIIMELTNDKPRLLSGTLLVDEPGKPSGGRLHCAREDYGWESTRYEIRAGRVYCDDFVVFPYLDDVLPRDGGLLLLPGSHKINFRPSQVAFSMEAKIIADEFTAWGDKCHAQGRRRSCHAGSDDPRHPDLDPRGSYTPHPRFAVSSPA